MTFRVELLTPHRLRYLAADFLNIRVRIFTYQIFLFTIFNDVPLKSLNFLLQNCSCTFYLIFLLKTYVMSSSIKVFNRKALKKTTYILIKGTVFHGECFLSMAPAVNQEIFDFSTTGSTHMSHSSFHFSELT